MATTLLLGDSTIQILPGDITRQDTDAIVNAANTTLMGGGGVDGAIHGSGGPAILDECRAIIAKIGKCATGEAAITSEGDLAVYESAAPRILGSLG